MSETNYFTKLIMLSLSDGNFLLLYGFCSPTNQKIRPWKQYKGKGKNQCIWKSILKEDELNSFLKKLTEPGELLLNNISFTSPQLYERTVVLSNDDLNDYLNGKTGPIKEYRPLTEFWNTHKRDLYNKILREFEESGIGGKKLYYSLVELFRWVAEECGINMINHGYRLGNFDFYHPLKHEFDFIIEPDKGCGLLSTTLKKLRKFDNNLIVNCLSKYRERTVSNQTKIFEPEIQVLEFTAKEPMVYVAVQIWDQKSGELIFSYNRTLMMNLRFNINMVTSNTIVSDPWAKTLIESASNKKELIENKIQKVVHLTDYNTLSVNSSCENEIDSAIEDGINIFSSFHNSYHKGFFVKNTHKDGEIQSFIKILEYINGSTVKHVVIADPFFSITAASKILARIPRDHTKVEVITSLCDINPDNGKIEEVSQSEKLQNFLEKNAHILHPKLLVWNLRRAGKQVFHDRYLLRYHNNGNLDGFLLSNSLNSMGQFYPFVIAPMDYEVCLEVIDYLNEMRDSDAQNKKSKKERIISEVIYDSAKRPNIQQEEQREELPYIAWFSKWRNSEGKVEIPRESFSDAISIVMGKWYEDSKLACKMLSAIGLLIRPWWLYKELAKEIKQKNSLQMLFQDEFVAIAQDAEGQRTHLEKGINSDEYRLFMMLSGNAEPDRIGFSLIVQESGHIWYGPKWLHSGYQILLYLTPARYIVLLEKLKSPMMFDILAFQLYHSNLFSHEILSLFIENGNLLVQLLCSDCILQEIEQNQLSFDDYKKKMVKLTLEKRVFQMIRMLSKVKLFVRTKSNIDTRKWSLLNDWLIERIATDIIFCSEEEQDSFLYWLNDCEAISNCELHYNLANCISDPPLKIRLLDKAMIIAESNLLECSYDRDVEKIGTLYINILHELYGELSEKMLFKRFINWSTFEVATEPELKNYNHDKWKNANTSAKRQLQVLTMYDKLNPDSIKVKEFIEMWGKRVYGSSNEEIVMNA